MLLPISSITLRELRALSCIKPKKWKLRSNKITWGKKLTVFHKSRHLKVLVDDVLLNKHFHATQLTPFTSTIHGWSPFKRFHLCGLHILFFKQQPWDGSLCKKLKSTIFLKGHFWTTSGGLQLFMIVAQRSTFFLQSMPSWSKSDSKLNQPIFLGPTEENTLLNLQQEHQLSS